MGTTTHNFTVYHYQGNTNRLTSIDGYNTTYSYNAIGQLLSSSNGTKSKYPTYDARGMITSVTSDAAHTDPYVKSYYDDNGLRYKKENYHGTTMVTTWYKYDASGNILAVYDDNNTTHTLQRAETPIYAANRIGSYYHGSDNSDHYLYELTDHLGTVRATFSNDPATPAAPKVESYADYYPYGLVLRSAVAERYRFGYQGQYSEYDPETETNHFELRDYDPIIGRWLGPDPYQEFYSSYVGMGNNPVSMTDPSGGSTNDGADTNDDIYKSSTGSIVYVTDTNAPDRYFIDGVLQEGFGGADGDWRNHMGKNETYIFNDNKPYFQTLKEEYNKIASGDILGFLFPDDDRMSFGFGGSSKIAGVAIKGAGKFSSYYAATKSFIGYTRHGLNQAIGRNGGRGVNVSAMKDALNSPKKVVQQTNGNLKYVGDKASVVLNPNGKIITTFGQSRGAQIYQQGRAIGGGAAQRRAIQRTGASYNPNMIR